MSATGLPLPPAPADVDVRLHLAAADQQALFVAGDLSLIHATGRQGPTRSHFDAEARIARATGHNGAGGWLGRWLTAMAPGGPLPALGLPSKARVRQGRRWAKHWPI